MRYILIVLAFMVSIYASADERRDVFVTYSADLNSRTINISAKIKNLSGDEDILLFPSESGFDDEHADTVSDLSATDGRGNSVYLEKTEYEKSFFGISFAGWRFTVPESGEIYVDAQLTEKVGGGYLGWQIMNKIRPSYAQISLESSFFTTEQKIENGITGMFEFFNPDDRFLHISARRLNDAYVYDFSAPGLIFYGSYGYRSYKGQLSAIDAYLTNDAQNLDTARLDEAMGYVLKAFDHAVRIYGGAPDKRGGLPYKVTVFINYDEDAEISGTAGVCLKGGTINLLTDDELLQFEENAAHEMLHLYNAYAYAGLIDKDSGREADTYWVIEGFNEYTAHKRLRDAGYYSDEGFYEYLSGVYGFYKDSDWKNLYNLPDAAAKYDDAATFLLVYLKGALAAFAFDEDIMRVSNGRYSIDDVMRRLYENYNKYQGRTFSSQDVLNIMSELAPGHDFQADFNFRILGTETMPNPAD